MQLFEGCRVLELGSTIAGPFAARLLADFGANVVKIEPPSGDAVRSMGVEADGVSLYAASIMRNKQTIAVDLRTPAGQDVVRRLARHMDVVIENFRPGTLERWNLGYPELSRDNPGLILARVSGYGQDGPYADRPGYGVNGEATSGLRALTGDPDRPPPRIATSLTDYIAGTYAAFGIAAALFHRTRTGRGQVIDMALYEGAMSYVEPHIPAYATAGVAARRAGSRLPNSTPNTLFPTRDGYVHIAAFADASFKRLTQAMNQPDLATDPRFSSARARNDNVDALETIIGDWAQRFAAEELEALLLDTGVPASRILEIPDLFADPHIAARQALLAAFDPRFGRTTVTAPVPRFSETPGKVAWLGRDIGADTAAVLRSVGGYTDAEIDELIGSGTVVQSADRTDRSGEPTKRTA